MKNLKILSGSLAAIILATSAMVPTVAQAQIEANVALTTDYVWRGVSQNNEDPALQGGFDYAHSSGFYAGVWGSNVDFVGPASLELDLYAGWTYEFDGGIGIDIGIIEYTYHGGDDEEVIVASDEFFVFTDVVSAGDLDFTEYYLGLSYSGFGFIYSFGDEFGDQYELSYGYDFEGFSVAAAYGNYDVNDDDSDYDYYSIGASTELWGVGLDLTYYDTDSQGELNFGEDLAEGRVVFSISKAF